MTTYTKINFANGQAPAISVTNLNSTEDAIESAHNELASTLSGSTGIVTYFPVDSVPAEWLKCDGSLKLRNAYTALYGIIGTTFNIGGGGEDSSNFRLPDCRGIFIRGWDNGRGYDSGRTFGSYQDSEVSSHFHTYVDDATAGYNAAHNITNKIGYATSTDRSFDNYPATASDSHPKNIAMIACIKT